MIKEQPIAQTQDGLDILYKNEKKIYANCAIDSEKHP